MTAPQELAYAEGCANQLRVAFDIVDLSILAHFLKGSALTDTIPVPMLIPGVATKVGRGIAALAVPALKGKKPSSSLVSEIRQNMREKPIEHIYRYSYL